MPQTLTTNLKILRVSYGGGNIDISVQEQYVDANGKSSGGKMAELVHKPEQMAIDLAAGEEWGDAQIEQLLREHEVMVKPGVPAIPEVPPVMDGDTVIRPGVPAVPATDPVYELAYAHVDAIVWL